MTTQHIPAAVLARFAIPSDCRLVLSVEDEQDSPDGHFASGNDADDAADVAHINEEREWNQWAWCIVTVTVTDDDASGSDYLGGCSYADAAQFMESGGYFDDMVTSALEQYATERDRLTTKYAR